ncbi:NAD-dependent epimerase/dehydratase family protein [Streptomyces cyaneochromogenes]|uniref:NAD-dependent epimerase/dehydratase family protein n=1 Tax=Streptomyces cyaneochromogenes TaxID=2496836 RepID=A0A3Q9EZS7_9ACTN|nr:sugar nucleotide-binding protein [Streptomyces cyaneochromogenes]AZQ39324.1 NAD-dependent epimerase/dehydratase family protein [Streptomyces cyaneochromogenes]
MTVMIIGGSGFLGTELVRQATATGLPTAATFATRPGSAPGVAWHALDLRDPERVEAVVAEAGPRLIVNATSGDSDWAVTAEGPVRLALAAAKYGCRLVHVSSDAVFSGARVHYDENATGTRNGVLFTDDIRCPVHVTDLAAALLELAARDASGVHHLAGPDAVSRHELGTLVAGRDGLDVTRLPAGLRANSALPGALDVRLDGRATQRKLRTTLRGAREFLAMGA